MNIFQGISGLEKGIDASWKRNSVFLNNIANNDTPNFKTSHVEFEELYKAALGDAEPGTYTDRQIDEATSGVHAMVIKDPDTTYRMDGSNVDIDDEMTGLAKNVIYYNTLTNKINGQFNQLRMAIREGK